MTCVKFLSDCGKLRGFEIKGHSSSNPDDEEGKIVCSAISSAAYMTANTISDIVGDKCKADVEDGFMRFEVEDISEISQTVLKGFKLHTEQLFKEYGNRIKLITEV